MAGGRPGCRRLDRVAVRCLSFLQPLVPPVGCGALLFGSEGLYPQYIAQSARSVGNSALYRAGRGLRDERWAVQSSEGDEVMPEQAFDIPDGQAICVKRYRANLRDELKQLISDELIEEHRTTAGQRRSDALERVLNYFRSADVAEKYAVLAVKPFAEYRIVALSGHRREPPRIVDDQIFKTPAEALHGVFLIRVRDLIGS